MHGHITPHDVVWYSYAASRKFFPMTSFVIVVHQKKCASLCCQNTQTWLPSKRVKQKEIASAGQNIMKGKTFSLSTCQPEN